MQVSIDSKDTNTVSAMPQRDILDLGQYFNCSRGLGVLSTANGLGEVDAAIYARPHVVEYDVVAFLMADRRSHDNLKTNPRAAYLFKENGDSYRGKRLFLTKIREEKEEESSYAWLRRKRYEDLPDVDGSDSFLVFFRVEKVVPLVGNGDTPPLS
jgi:hypothetical protein